MKPTTHDDTIAAVATPPGEGGVGIVRLSGPAALDIAARLFRSSHGRDPLQGPGRVFHGHALDADGAVLDEVLLHCMRAPHSYTREDVVEINAHGGLAPVQAILARCLVLGARLARPGEFTLRAFLNGRIDLVQAEAVLDTIRARTKAGLQAAQAAAGGTLSREVYALCATLRGALARVEAAVDFPEEDLPELVDAALIADLRAARRRMATLLANAERGRLLREGAAVAIAGRPNVGKSSLFNALLRDQRAIVTEHAGTTRDRLEEYIAVDGIPVRLVDTAGLRVSDDAVEQIGVGLARRAAQEAQLVLFVCDASVPFGDEDTGVAQELAQLDTPVLLVLNKSDLAPDAPVPPLPFSPAATARIAAISGAGLEALEAAMATQLAGSAHHSADQALLTRAHQTDSVRRAAEHLDRLLAAPNQSPEFLALDLREALDALGEITGETTPDDVLGLIFGQFCIGK